MKIFLVRHGETTSDIENRYGGSYDDHLTPRGRKQLEATAKDLSGKDIEVIFTSKLIRAKQSAGIIQTETACEVEAFEGIQERGSGILAGLIKTEALELHPEIVEAQKNPEYTVPGGESLADFQSRVLEAFKNICSKDYSRVVVVSHGGPIKQILKHLNMPIPTKIGDGEIIEISV